MWAMIRLNCPPVKDENAAAAREIRHKLESFHVAWMKAQWDLLGLFKFQDRYLRYAARVAIEWQPMSQWQEKALTETRHGGHQRIGRIDSRNAQSPTEITPKMRRRKLSIGFRILPSGSYSRIAESAEFEEPFEEQLLEACRAYGLCFIRSAGRALKMRRQSPHDSMPLSAQQTFVNKELSGLLVYLNSRMSSPKP